MPLLQDEVEYASRASALHHAMHLANIRAADLKIDVNADSVLGDAEKFVEFLTSTTQLRSV